MQNSRSLTQSFRRWLRALRNAPDRLLHSSRRKRALARVAGSPPPAGVLVLCHGNICRSPFAEAVLRRELDGSGIGVESAGFFGPGRPSPSEAQLEARRRGIDLSLHRSQLLTPDLAAKAGLVITMDAAQARAVRELYGKRPEEIALLGDFDPDPVEKRRIRDPIEQSADVYASVYARIERCARTLVAGLAEAASPLAGE